MKKSLVVPDFSDDDIADVERLLGITFDEPRQAVLRSNESFDIQACPGSGKTTLLVAKLAILARKWTEPRRGICVLSHTNVARKEIEQKLAGNSSGSRLLQYPHFVGTIHSFINQYLSLPRLRSDGCQIRMIDDEICGSKCRSLLYRKKEFRTAMLFLKMHDARTPDRTITTLRFEGPELELGSAAGVIPCGKGAESYSILSAIKNLVFGEGFFRHDDMFSIAERQLMARPVVAHLLRHRFPVVFVDEMQDTSELQNRLLSHLFPKAACRLRHRYGDSNQAIYDWGETKATSDPFPATECREIPNSKRFGPWIASVVEPLACQQVAEGLKGEGPPAEACRATTSTMPHTIFLFDAGTHELILPAFGKVLLENFADTDLSRGSRYGLFRAIGQVGRPGENQDHQPRSLGNYWPKYQTEATRLEPHPLTLVDHIHLAQRICQTGGNCAAAVDLLARGVVELVYRVEPKSVRRRSRAHRWLEDALMFDERGVDAYRRFIWRWGIARVVPRPETWEAETKGVRAFLQTLIGEGWPSEAEEFVQWSENLLDNSLPESTNTTEPNEFRFEQGGRSVAIRVGTIHSVKGQTHTATLVLDTYYYRFGLESLLDWLLGKNRGWKKAHGKMTDERLRLIFTAMTRPTHLLCLAMRREAFGDNLDADPNAKALRDRGWLLKGPTDLS